MINLNLQFFGGRGASSGIAEKSSGTNDNLDKNKIRRANDSSIVDMGDIINRTYERGREEISTFEFSESEKKEAVLELKRLSTNALESAAKAVNPYASGRGRLTTSQKTGSAADVAASDRAKIDNYMNDLRKKSADISRKKSSANLAQQLTKAQSEGKMEIYINGKRYYRKSKRGGWYS